MNRILLGSSNDNISKIKNDEVIIDIKEDTNILIEKSKFNNFVFNIKNSNLNIFILSEKEEDKNYKININKGNVSFNSISYNSKNVIINVDLNEELSNIYMHNCVIAKNNLVYDIKVNHNAKLTNSDINNNGVTKDAGSIKFNVSSYAKKKSNNSKINQDSKIITLNDTNNNEINPVLLIDEYETESKHAAFIGNFKEDELFYLMSRGLSKEKSEELLLNGLLVGSLDLCFNEKENLRKKLNDEWR